MVSLWKTILKLNGLIFYNLVPFIGLCLLPPIIIDHIKEKKVYKAIILRSELLEQHVKNLKTAADISQVIIGNGTSSKAVS